MRQVFQDLRSGATTVDEAPAPGPRGNCLLIRTRRTLISAGTERMLVEFGKASLIGKARSQPDKVKQVLDKIKTDGLLATLEAVFRRLDEPLPLGYCNAGVVLEVGRTVTEFKPGDRVISNGPHSEIVAAAKNLCAKIPDDVDDERAAFTVLGSIALQGIRLAGPTLGEKFVVYGLGLVGLVAVQLLRANGCEVMGVDLNPDRLALARSFGAVGVHAGETDAMTAANAWTLGQGVDGVLIAAAAKTDEIIHHAAEMCRRRGRIVLVGVVGLNLRRPDFYEKEQTFQVSCSYGPGRYDPAYEEGGQDYPRGFVRWTAQRNFEAVLEMIRGGRLAVGDLVTHRFPLAEAPEAYRKVSEDRKALAVLLEYAADADRSGRVEITRPPAAGAGKARVAVIGTGNFAKVTMGPALARTGATIAYACDLNGAAAAHFARGNGALQATSDYHDILGDPDVDAVLVTVGHSLHARLVCEVLDAGKHAFVEKPLAMSPEEVRQVLAASRRAPDRLVMVGYNRRFSPHVVKIKQLLAGRSEPLAMNMTINAGMVPIDHWMNDPVRGGGRIVGEGCHFIDLMIHLTGSKVRTVAATWMDGVAVKEEKMSISLGFDDGSVGTVNYFANGPKSYPKEMVEVFSEGRVLRLENYRKTLGYGVAGFRKFKTSRQDKGHRAELAAFCDRVAAGGEALIPLDELVNSTLASFAAMTAARDRRTVTLPEEYAEVFAGEAS